MPDRQNFGQCTLVCWGIGAILGLLTVITALLLGKLALIWALLLGLFVTAILGWLLTMMLCKTNDAPAAYAAPAAAFGAAGAAQAATSSASTGHAAPAAAQSDSSTPADTAVTEAPSEAAEADPFEGSETRAYETGTVGLTRADDDMDGDLRVASAPADATQSDSATPADTATTEAPSEDTQADPFEGSETRAYETGTVGLTRADDDMDGDLRVTSASADASTTDDTASAEAAAQPDDAASGPGRRPEALSAPREGGADNLKEIKGVGPKLEELLHSLGFYHFDQIAGWTSEEVSWVDQNLKGFKGRVSRDNWVDQAKTLAAGGQTEFSKKVSKGGVY